MKFLRQNLHIFIFVLVIGANAQETQIKINKFTESIYMLVGQGGNIGVFVGEDGVFMIDDQFAPLTPKILSAIRTITEKPVKYLINTHFHGDHTGGNENIFNEGAVIVSHENVRKRMSANQSAKEALPVVTFTDDIMFHLNGDDVLISHVHNAHTDGDAIIYFTNNNVIHTGDTYFNGKFPFIDTKSGGSINGYIAAVEKVLLLADDQTKIIPGHREASNKAELKVFYNMLVTIRDRIQAEIDKGKTLEEVTANSSLTEEYNEQYGEDWFIKGDSMRATVYKCLKKLKTKR